MMGLLRVAVATVVAAVLLSLEGAHADASVCEKYQNNDLIRKCGNKYFNLEKLKGKDGKSLLTTVDTARGYVYYLQFENGGVPKLPNCTLDSGSNLGVQVRTDGVNCYFLGKTFLVNWDYDNSTNQLTIGASGGLNHRSMVIKPQCSFGAKYTTLTETGETGLTYNFQLSLPSKRCTSSPSHSGGGSGGSKKSDAGAIVLAVFFGLLIGYFVIGAVYLAAAQGKRGADMVPNREFWVMLPGLVQDGFHLTVAKLKGTASYDVEPAPTAPPEGDISLRTAQAVSIHSWSPQTYDIDQGGSGQRRKQQPVYEFVENIGGVSET